ncbi:MAG: hypothetical protein EXR75_10715 [Myxococcales bacterium]|nr:hypothetical protein [Myxococcales bacterium]
MQAHPSFDSGAIEAEPTPHTVRCLVCLEAIPAELALCPECGEPPHDAPASSAGSPGSVAPPPGGWLAMHWRPLVTMSAVGALIAAGIALRYLAPERFRSPLKLPVPAALEATCPEACWLGEACEEGRCLWRPPNDVGHLPVSLTVAGPFALPADVSDVIALDGERYAASHLLGVQFTSARTGESLSLVNDAPQVQRLFRVGSVVYASAPERIYVIDAATMSVLKSIEVGKPVTDFAIGTGGERVLAALPAARAVAVLATDHHAEVSRFFFGDDPIAAVALDDAGTRALAVNGDVPLLGLRPASHSLKFGAVFSFDPSRLPSAQDRVRTGADGNPAAVLAVPDSRSSFVVLRETDEVLPLGLIDGVTARREKPISTCRQPEQIVLVRSSRRALVRCNAGRAVDVLDLAENRVLRRIELNARVSDLVVSPDGKQALLALPRDGQGSIGILDLDTYELRLQELAGEPHRLRLTPDGRTVAVISDRTKSAWVLR